MVMDDELVDSTFDQDPDGEPASEKSPGATQEVVISESRTSSEASDLLPYLVVGIGASAGGVEAYIELFSNLPPDTGMAFAVIPHLSANQRSYLPEILARHTSMNTVTIETGMRPKPNRVHLLPPNARVRMEGARFVLEHRQTDGMPHTIDYFFQSLAADQRNRAVGVVLSGMDSDGVIGLKAIKGEAGISIVQAPVGKRRDTIRRRRAAEHKRRAENDKGGITKLERRITNR
jgi:two-component system, chemotaxis family, CheB/CheR fusion protein